MLALFLIWMGCCVPAAALDAVPLSGLRQSGDIAGAGLGLRFLRDAGRSLSLENVMAAPAARFVPLQPRDVNQRFQQGDYWLQTSLHNDTAAPITWVLRHPMPLTDYVDYWVVRQGVPVAHARGGDRTRLSERQLPYRMASLRHSTAPGDTVQIYIRLRNKETSPMHLTLALSDETRFLRTSANDQLLLGILYGVPLALLMYGFGSWLIHRRRSSLIYACYVLAVLASWLGINGQLAEYVFTDQPETANFMLLIFLLLVTICNSLFAREFLQTRRNMPRFDAFFVALIVLALAGIALRLLGWHLAVVQLTAALVFVHGIAPIVAIVALGREARFARWYLVAQVVYHLTLVIGMLGVRYAELSYENYFVYCQLAFIADLLLLGVAQQDRLRLLRLEKTAFEQRYHSALALNNADMVRQLAQQTTQLHEARQRSAFLAAVKTATGRIADGQFGVRLAPESVPELAELAGNVNAMAAALARLDGARKRWIAAISHELRIPLFSLQCETEALLDGVKPLNRRAVVSIHEEVLRLTRLVSDLHEVALSYLRPLPCTFTCWQLRSLLIKKQDDYQHQARARGLAFTLAMPPGTLEVRWDQVRIGQLLDNLVHNSISYTDAPGQVALALAVDQDTLSITLQDSAPGIAPDEAKQLFEPLYRADSARSRRAGGSGLGLSICQAIVHAHGGQITAAPSTLGGLAIRIALPMAPPAP
ncbi:7TM diverse intracellular signaling domain-containing protein [Massilia sp. CF038]|uniref:7TM diverse intracellular signaling domain-containing protein n=1 Tax=Massilia sp. CF038 TaxID=1881045 RepID=UPI0009233D7C|nr:7TM diverse intracellular signaling domain-containing protein [Massilia sp. CF038]SHH54193.1 Signal transduction histidine kinase [Massilia sp. CF038]